MAHGQLKPSKFESFKMPKITLLLLTLLLMFWLLQLVEIGHNC